MLRYFQATRGQEVQVHLRDLIIMLVEREVLVGFVHGLLVLYVARWQFEDWFVVKLGVNDDGVFLE